MSISRESVVYAYRLILGREPESDEAVTRHMQLDSLRQLREIFFSSAEFKSKQHDIVKSHSINGKVLSEPKVVFLHLPKTGGTTLHYLLSRNFEEKDICPERFNSLYSYTIGELATFKLFSGHFDFLSCDLLPGKKKVITLLREPKARLLSVYYFLKAHKKNIIKNQDYELAKLANEFGVKDFFSSDEARRHPSINNALVKTLSGEFPLSKWPQSISSKSHEPFNPHEYMAVAKQNLNSLYAFGIMEQYDRSISYIFRALGFDEPQVIEKRQVLSDITTQNPNLKEVVKEPIDNDVDQLIDSLIECDVMLYEYALSLFEERAESLI